MSTCRNGAGLYIVYRNCLVVFAGTRHVRSCLASALYLTANAPCRPAHPRGQGLNSSRVCVNCNATNQISLGGINATCTSCPANQTGWTNGTICVPACQPGWGLDAKAGFVCKQCNATSASPGGSASCVACISSAGTVANANNTACVPGCPAGQGLATQGKAGKASTACTACSTTKQYSPGGPNATCANCPAGQLPWTNASICVPNCPAGSGLNTNFTCAVCPAGQTSAGGITPCAACAANTVPNAIASACVAGCLPGQGLIKGVCKACATGTFSPGGPNAACTACPAGKTPSADKTACLDFCPA